MAQFTRIGLAGPGLTYGTITDKAETVPPVPPAPPPAPTPSGGGGGYYGGPRLPEIDRLKRLHDRWAEDAQRAHDLRHNIRDMLEPPASAAPEKKAAAAEISKAIEDSPTPWEIKPPTGILSRDDRRRFTRLQRRLRQASESLAEVEASLRAAPGPAEIARMQARAADEEAAAFLLLMN